MFIDLGDLLIYNPITAHELCLSKGVDEYDVYDGDFNLDQYWASVMKQNYYSFIIVPKISNLFEYC